MSRHTVVQCLLSATLALGAATASIAATPDGPPRLAELAPARDPASSEARTITPVGQYDRTRVMQLQLKAGSTLPSHAAPERVLVIVLAGTGHFDFYGSVVPLQERQVLHMAPGEPHAVVADSDLDLLLVRIAGDDAATP